MTNVHSISSMFFQCDTVTLAKQLLGTVFTKRENNTVLSGRIVETEAYLPHGDEANHAFRGKTERNNALFLSSGHLYIYQIHRYFCLNVVAEPIDSPGCVLIRAMEPVSGLDVMRDRRKTSDSRALLNGPGKICQAFGIDKCLNGLDLKSNGKAITLTAYEPCQNISLTNRVGVTTNKSAKLRFVDTQSDCLSRKV